MNIDRLFKDWSNAYVGHDLIVMPPTWKNTDTTQYTFIYTDSELNSRQYVDFFKLCSTKKIANPRLFTPSVLEFASLFHPLFFHAVKYSPRKKSEELTDYTRQLQQLRLNYPISTGIEVATTKYYLQSAVFLTGVTLSAAIIQNRWSIGTLESKLNRLWQTGSLVKHTGIKKLADLDILSFVKKEALQIQSKPLHALFDLKLFFSQILKELVNTIPFEEAYIKTTKLNPAQQKKFGFINILKSILGKNMQAVLLYGSATNSEKFADYDLIIIVKDLKDALENLAGKSPKYNGLEINISVFDEKDFWTYQLASGDNLMDHAICLYGEARIPHKASNDLLARNFSFGFIRFRQLLGMAAQLNNSPTESDDKRNLLNYFTKIPLNVSKGIQGCYGKVTTNEEIRKWFITKLQFNVDEQIENSKKGKHIEAISTAAWATQEIMKLYDKKLKLCSVKSEEKEIVQ